MAVTSITKRTNQAMDKIKIGPIDPVQKHRAIKEVLNNLPGKGRIDHDATMPKSVKRPDASTKFGPINVLAPRDFASGTYRKAVRNNMGSASSVELNTPL